MPSRLALDGFLPYRLSVLTNQVSAALAASYEARFGLNPSEWRVMAALGECDGLSSSEVCTRTAMDKVQVSRAVSALADAGRIARKVDETDGRVVRLSLSASGRMIYDEIVPLALEWEVRLMAALGADDRAAIDRVLTILTARVRELTG